MTKFVGIDRVADALFQAGAIKEKPDTLRRIVIDIEVGKPGRIYLERFADAETLLVAIESGVIVEGGEQ